ncbi:hypothetical protein GJ496_011698 [Pomphorhynchus laevis]|nr:hypothetical protein GJ496_011698 [Pomphorhynchus laevis]
MSYTFNINIMSCDINCGEMDMPFLYCHIRGMFSLAPADESELKELCIKGFSLIKNSICQIKERESNVGECLVKLGDVKMRFPRIRRPSPERKPTKWEKFAREKGIRQSKRDKLIYMSEDDQWHPRYGYKGANKLKKARDWIVELPDHGKVPDANEVFNGITEKRKTLQSRYQENHKKNIGRRAKELICPDALEETKGITKAIKFSKKGDSSLGKFSHEAEGQLMYL